MDRSEWVLVPRDFTAEMEDAGFRAIIEADADDEGAIMYSTAGAVYSAMLDAAPPPPAEQASGEHGKHMAVLERLERALPDVGLNGWIDGVAAVQYARATLSQRPVAGAEHAVVPLSILYGITGSFGRARARHVAALESFLAALAPQQPEKGEG